MKTRHLQIIAVVSSLILLILVAGIAIHNGEIKETTQPQETEAVDVNGGEFVEIKQVEGQKAQDIKASYDVYNNKVDVDLGIYDDKYNENCIKNGSPYVDKFKIIKKSKNTHIIIDLEELCGYTTFVKNNCLYLHFESVESTDKKVIVIDAGHGGSDVGAASGSTYEKDINIDVARYVKQKLYKNYLVLFTRDGDSLPSVEERADFVNKIRPKAFVSIHCNDSDVDLATGIEVLYNQSDSRKHGSKWLADKILKNIIETTNAKNRGLVYGREIHIVRHSKVPVALVELGFMSNTDEVKKLKSKAYQKKCAAGIANAIEEAIK